MLEWEYRKINLSELPRGRDDVDVLNDAGKSGWELVAITGMNFAFFFKRARAKPTASS